MNDRSREWRRFRRETEINNRKNRISGKNTFKEKYLRDGDLSKSKGVPEYRLNEEFKCKEKNWKHMYFRKNKLLRARQLGTEYPPKTIRQILDDEDPTNPEEVE